MTTSSGTVLDLFSGGGGMSCGFRAAGFRLIGAVDFELGKPGSGSGSLDCNRTFERNLGLRPVAADLAALAPSALRRQLGLEAGEHVSILISCAPCTGFSRARATNHLVDDPRNSLVLRSAAFVEEFRPAVFVMENARELLRGNFVHHFRSLERKLRSFGYQVCGENHVLSNFGLPQKRERALIVAVRAGLPLLSLRDLWEGRAVAEEATTVRRAIGHLSEIEAGDSDSVDAMHRSPRFRDSRSLERIRAVPRDGGSWIDLLATAHGRSLLTPAMARTAALGKFGSHPDVYGRMAWDRPSVTIKRECGHVGNGRYAHPVQDRLCSVREMASLQGFPNDYLFEGSLANMYRHIGDAVPPLISFQIARLCQWILGGKRANPRQLVLPGTSLRPGDILAAAAPARPRQSQPA